jgi:hypothetical protein
LRGWGLAALHLSPLARTRRVRLPHCRYVVAQLLELKDMGVKRAAAALFNQRYIQSKKPPPATGLTCA